MLQDAQARCKHGQYRSSLEREGRGGEGEKDQHFVGSKVSDVGQVEVKDVAGESSHLVLVEMTTGASCHRAWRS
jgi:hypothetical protein